MNITDNTYNNALGHLTLDGQINALILGQNFACKQKDQLDTSLTAYHQYYSVSTDEDERMTLYIMYKEIQTQWDQYDKAIKTIRNLIADRIALRRQIRINRKRSKL
jgi:hypothetical protein